MKTIIMKTKTILKIGVLSIIILFFIISPVLKSNVSEVEAQNWAVGPTQEELKLIYQNYEQSPEVLCAGVGKGGWLNILSQAWWEHVNCVIQKSVMEGLGTMFSVIIKRLVSWILWAFNPATYGGFVENDAVLSVWKSIRDIINLILVLGLVFIAIATILGMKKYSWQQTLWKLVVVALLVNFSLVMAGMILDVSHFFAYTFLNLTKTESDGIAESIINSFGTETMNSDALYLLSGVDTVKAEETKGWGLSMGNFLIGAVIIIIIEIFAFIALLAVFIAMIVRSFIIVALLCLSPIAFAAWIFPDTEKLWKMWWQQFIKWCTYPIIFALMLWIGVSVVTNIKPGSSADLGMIPSVVRLFLFSMFLVGGLIFSVQGGGATASFVMKQAGKARSAVVRAAVTGIQRSAAFNRIGQGLTQLPVLNTIGYKMIDQHDRATRSNVRKYEEEMEKQGRAYVERVANNPAPSRMNKDAYDHWAAARNVAIKHGWISDPLHMPNGVQRIRESLNDPSLDIVAAKNALPQFFDIVSGRLQEIDQTATNYMDLVLHTVQSMNTKDLAAVNHKERIIDQVMEQARLQARTLGQDESAAAQTAFERFNQQLAIRLRGEQLTAFYNNIDDTEWANRGYGGPNGQIIQAIQKNPTASNNFDNKLNNRVLRETFELPEGATITPPPPPPTP